MIGKKLRKIIQQLILIFFILKTRKYPAYVSNHYSNREKKNKIILYGFQTKKHGITLYCSKKLPALLRRTTSKHRHNFYCLNCFYSFRTESKLESHRKYVQKKTFVMLRCLLKTLRY